MEEMLINDTKIFLPEDQKQQASFPSFPPDLQLVLQKWITFTVDKIINR